MDDADSALLGERNGHVRLSDGVHGGADDRNVEADITRELRLRAGACRDYIGARG